MAAWSTRPASPASPGAARSISASAVWPARSTRRRSTTVVRSSPNFTDTLTLAANISGPGELRKAGVGTLILTGDNTYRGSTTVDGGTLSVNGSIVNSAL